MKKYIIFVLFYFLFSIVNLSSVNAKSSYECNMEVYDKKYFKCNIIIDEEPIIIESDSNLKINSVNSGDYKMENSSKIIFYKSGEITYGPANIKHEKYTIYASYLNNVNEQLSSYEIKINDNVTTTKKSNINYLEMIYVNDEEIENFKRNQNKYYITYENDVKEVKINVKREDEMAVVKVNGPKKLTVGDNEYTISVTAEDGTIRYYKLVITRKKKLSSNTIIKDIKVKDYNLDFDGTSKTYHLNINEDANKLDINVILQDKDSTCEIIGNNDLLDGNEIKIIVTAPNGDKETYRIIINKVKKEEKSNTSLLIAMTFLIILIILFIFLYKNYGKRKKIKQNDNLSNETRKMDIIENKNQDVNLEKTKVLNLSVESKKVKKINFLYFLSYLYYQWLLLKFSHIYYF